MQATSTATRLPDSSPPSPQTPLWGQTDARTGASCTAAQERLQQAAWVNIPQTLAAPGPQALPPPWAPVAPTPAPPLQGLEVPKAQNQHPQAATS